MGHRSLKPPAQLAGRLVVSGDPEWDECRRAWNLAVDQRPRAVAYPEAVEDVVAVVELARSEGLRVAVQCTGHNAAPVGSLERTILLKTERMRQVEVDPVTRTARCEAGVLWPEVGGAAASFCGGSPRFVLDVVRTRSCEGRCSRCALSPGASRQGRICVAPRHRPREARAMSVALSCAPGDTAPN